MNAGDLDRRVIFQSQSSSVDAIGQPLNVWANVGSAWAKVKFMTGQQAIKSDASTSIAQASIRVRYREDITPGMQAVQGASTYRVLAVLPDVSGRVFTDLVCEVVS